jgi:hypothetical protein
MLPRRVILVCTGALCGPHQRSHKCDGLRKSFSSTRGHGRRMESCEVISSSSIRRATYEHSLWVLKEPRHHRAALHAACVLLLFALLPQHVATALPCPPHAALRLAAPYYAGAAPLSCALHVFRTSRKPKARPARLAAFACFVYVCVCWVM